MRRYTALFLVISLILLSGKMIARERQGARIIVHKREGQILKGELIAIQQTHLLMLNSKTKYDERIDISDVKVITVVGKPRIGLRIIIGSLIGAGIGSALGFAEGDDPSYTEDSFIWGPQMVDPKTAEEKALGKGILWAGIGAALGASMGELIGIDKKIQFEGMSEEENKGALEYLRSKARVSDYKLGDRKQDTYIPALLKLTMLRRS